MKNKEEKERTSDKEWTEDKEQLKERIVLATEKLYEQQQEIKEKKLPVIVLIEGWGASGKGELISGLVNSIDSRFYKVLSVGVPTEDERRKPFLWRHFCNIPENGKFLFLDSGWMDETVKQRIRGEFSEEEYKERLESICAFERQLVDAGYLVLKIFLEIDKKTQKKRISNLLKDKDTAWRVGQNDLWQKAHYNNTKLVFNEYIEATDTRYAPWYIFNSSNSKQLECYVLELLVQKIVTSLETKPSAQELPQEFALCSMPKLSDVSLDKTMTEEQYKTELKKAQKKLKVLHNRIYRLKKPVVIVYEGWDAAGKGGNIKRVTGALDARGYEVLPIAAPTPEEKNRHYLWRFWKRLPRTGHIAIFDRSWYGRVMVERVENFCSERDWKNAYAEINEFEKEITDWGAVVVKFWIHIDNETQLARFNDRKSTPEKQWKITDEDWRNRERWEDYEKAVDEMLEKTSTVTAPWHIVESVDKKYARIKALKILIAAIEREI